MSTIGSAWAEMQATLEAGRRVYRLLDGDAGDSEQLSAASSKSESAPEWDGDYSLTVKDMSFTYSQSESPTLRNINLSIGKNDFVVFLGESGSGKSTLLRAIAGLYARDGMGICLGNMDLTRESLRTWRRRFAYVDQNCPLFNMTVRENIALGGTDVSRDDVVEAAKKAGADEFICNFPDGYDTLVGERGTSLSGGQRQRIAIARALVRKAEVLLFDEAASALDTESERQLMSTIRELNRDHTVLIATHNRDVIIETDNVIFMVGGEARV